MIQCAPPYVVAVVFALATAIWSDKTGKRAPFLAFNCIISIIGCVMISYTKTVASRYTGVFIALSGCTANVPALLAYVSMVHATWCTCMNALYVTASKQYHRPIKESLRICTNVSLHLIEKTFKLTILPSLESPLVASVVFLHLLFTVKSTHPPTALVSLQPSLVNAS
jgi:hypothetical protein